MEPQEGMHSRIQDTEYGSGLAGQDGFVGLGGENGELQKPV